ncbi:Lrp/AsnC family transcriptional regulator [Meridianimarinicoccus aquatilis]|uniref:Lrp/AsnC family transcriptional regulator n=1 Tax=Meridianimarinicoccus aquatilis TaxID=2552766 RepID=A0A4V3BB00_9RHOB|nr:Lrp/AsnC family transcriptional regulator [Fluviibacterium aquatile]QIE43458.1 Lrp/AsnC family transcriptional regulator [Rhodobacteraceae bacterium SC52]TDL85179.1 Lrp/AsnC family transcriptional regulator [Fluviibacterium aquatile]
MRLTSTDKMILELLREDGRRSITEIASIIGLSRPTVRHHVDKLVREKVIRRFTVDIDTPDESRPSGVRAMFDVRLRRNVCGMVFSSVSSWSELVSAWSTSGSTDMRILVEAADQNIIEDLRDRLARHPEVASLTTTMVLKTWCERISGIEERAPEEYLITRKGEPV